MRAIWLLVLASLVIVAVAFASTSLGGAAALWARAESAASHSSALAAPGGRAPQPTLLLVAPAALASSAELWQQHRAAQGWEVVRLEPSAVEATNPAALLSRLRRAACDATQRGAPTVAVLLLGDSDVIPTFRFAQPDPRLVDRSDPEFASDHPYQRLDDLDELPDLALGRVPARSNEEALAVLQKIQRYEAPPELDSPVGRDDDWRRRLTFIAGEGRFGAADSVLESLFRTLVDRMVPERYELSMTYASPSSVYCPPPSSLAATITSRFAEPAILVNYLGHGYASGLDRMRWGAKRLPMFGIASIASSAELSAPRSSLPIAFFGCCSVGWFDRPEGAPSLAEALLLAPGGPVAIVAGSRPTHPYGTAILQKDLARRLLAEQVQTVGQLDLEATRSMLQQDSDDAALDLVAKPIAALSNWPCSLRELRLMHVRMYNLLGDPCTRIAHPPPELDALTLAGRELRGRSAAIAVGTVEVVLESARESTAHGPLTAPPLTDSGDLEAIAAANYPRANQREIWRSSVPIREGSFELALPDPLPPGATLVRCVATGVDSSGARIDRLGAIRIASPP